MDGLKTIESTGKGLLEFVEEYRRLSLLPPPKKKILPLKDTLEGIRLMFEGEAAEKDIQLDLDLDDPGAEISADPQQLEMVLLNLLRNAFDSYTEGNRQKYVRIRARMIDKHIHISVDDNGPGIDKALIDQVFVPFFSTKEQGSGIGLSLARQVMNKHEGSIHLESEAGKGTVVTLVFN